MQVRLTSPGRPDRVANGFRFAAHGDYSGAEYVRGDIFLGPVSLVGLLEANESCGYSKPPQMLFMNCTKQSARYLPSVHLIALSGEQVPKHVWRFSAKDSLV